MKHFQFSWRITLVCFVLASIMVRCSFWQWDRYKRKVVLVATFEANSTAAAHPLSSSEIESETFDALWNKKVLVRGTYDFEHEIIVTNKKAASGPGHHVLTPLRIEGSEKAILVSRGFIPFADRDPSSWTKYQLDTHETVQGVLKPSIRPWIIGPKNPAVGGRSPFARIWIFEEAEKMAQQLPYPTVAAAYIQRIGGAPDGGFPQQAISIEVPPSTHFGYTIEWALLAVATLVIGFLLQAFPQYRGLSRRVSRER